jgi:hypothetical protein
MQNHGNKVVVIGLDCAEPKLVFERFRGKLPNLDRLMDRGVRGRLRSCDPPITVPAWSVMMSSKDPGTLGIYGFRNRSDHSYDKMAFATGAAVREPRVWDHLGKAGKKVIALGVPGTYPLGPPGQGRQEGDRARRAGHLSAPAGQRYPGRLLPDAEHRQQLHLSAGDQARDQANGG